LAQKLHQKGAASAATAQATFVTKQMPALKRVLELSFIKPYFKIKNFDYTTYHINKNLISTQLR